MKQLQFFLALSVCVLLVLGLVMIFSASSAEILDHSLAKSLHADLLKQMFSALGGWILALAAWKIGWRRWLELSSLLFSGNRQAGQRLCQMDLSFRLFSSALGICQVSAAPLSHPAADPEGARDELGWIDLLLGLGCTSSSADFI